MYLIKKEKPNIEPLNKIKNKLCDIIDIAKLPKDISISTITITCKIGVKFNSKNIASYINLNSHCILSVACGIPEDETTNRSLIQIKKTSKKKKKKNIFFNQVTMNIFVSNKKKKPINVKIFSNGAIQMTGCKTVENAIEVISKLIIELNVIKAIIDKDGKLEFKPFYDRDKCITYDDITKFSIDMINSNFCLPFKIERNRLYSILQQDKIETFYDPIKHACVRIRFSQATKIISIFVFEKGNIIITGAQNCSQINDTYNFINTLLLTNYKFIVKNDNIQNINIIKNINEKLNDDDNKLNNIVFNKKF